VDRERARRGLLLQARYAIEAGVDVLQIREPTLEATDLARIVEEVVALARGTRSRVVVNDRLDVALACGASGVHLRTESVSPAEARSIAPQGFTIGRSVHGVEEAVDVASSVDYLIAGTVWPSDSKPGRHPLLGISGLAAVVNAVRVPVLAIGGVTLDRLSQVAGAGAAGLAAIGLFVGPETTEEGSDCRAVPLNAIVSEARQRFDMPLPPS
jgi:thiamine-phosphate diphosphorylase